MRCALVVALVVAGPAAAYPWMVKHNYGSCAACHVDPSGGGQLKSYGRAQAELLVRFRTQKPPPGTEEEVPPTANFLWFLALPDAVNLSGNFRMGALVRPTAATPVVPLLMATDLSGAVTIADLVVLKGTAGFGLRNLAGPAIVAPQCNPAVADCGPAFLAREYWAGIKLADEAVMIRAGRINQPFGLRNNEHTTYVRALTETDINVQQQLGLAVSYNSEALRGEVMGLAGNFQLGPDRYRQRGYAAFMEYAFTPATYLGVSSLITWAQDSVDPFVRGTAGPTELIPTTRHAHGLFFRWAPAPSFALLAEGDLLAWTTTRALDRLGFAALVQGDWEPLQGLHVMLTLEGAHRGDRTQQGPSLGLWASVAWYFFSHLELRVDNIVRRADATRPITYELLAQLHFFL